MAKTEETKRIERALWKFTNKIGTFGAFEVTIGWYGNERVDYMTYDTKGIFRCYEIKVSKSDFYSKNHNSFVGHYNYYVMPEELLPKVEIPDGIGVFVVDEYNCLISRKKATKRAVEKPEELKNYLIRCLARDAQKVMESEDVQNLAEMNREIAHLRKEVHDLQIQQTKVYIPYSNALRKELEGYSGVSRLDKELLYTYQHKLEGLEKDRTALDQAIVELVSSISNDTETSDANDKLMRIRCALRAGQNVIMMGIGT